MLRQATDELLNLTFPLWGIISPLAAVILILVMAALHQTRQHEVMGDVFPYVAIALSFSIGCLLLKRVFACDMFAVDKDGIKMPRFIGMNFRFRTYIPWQRVELVTAISGSDQKNSRLRILQTGGKNTEIPISQLQPEFIEQFILATRMWAPNRCDESLSELQEVLRNDAHASEQSSYTELWEEELGRRFCPTSYIPLEVGKVLRNSTLKIVSHLSSGGLSALYLCQLNGKQLVVLKEAVIPEDGVESVREKAKELFEREARLLMKIEHQSIVHVLDCFTELDRNYLLMEYINGIDLRQMVAQNGPQKMSDVLEWAIQVALGLKYLHERELPIIHRDLTPDNIVLRNDGSAIIVDFGAANELIGTATGTFVGKHSFISPEQLRGKATAQSDIYAFGCTLFFLLTGREPVALSPSNPREFVPDVSEEFAELIESCTQLEASDRYQTIAQMLPVLRRLSAQSLVA